MVLGIRGWRRIGLGVEMGGFRNQGLKTDKFRGGDGGFRNQGWRRVGLGVEKGRFSGGDG